MRQLSVVLVKVPLPLMYWPAPLRTATCTWRICWSSSTRPLTTMRDSVNAVPSVGDSSVSDTTGGLSPGKSR